jgi:hypothetical protein
MAEIVAMLAKILLYSGACLFFTFVVGTLLIGAFGDRLSLKGLERMKRFGWLVAGLMFACLGAGIMILVFHQISVGSATVRSRGGPGSSVSLETSPLLFSLAVIWELFCGGLLLAVAVGYLRKIGAK